MHPEILDGRAPHRITASEFHHRRLPQKRWMRPHASSSTAFDVAYEMRKNGDNPNAAT